MDGGVRSARRTEEKFFGECDAGKVHGALLPIALRNLGPATRRIHPGRRLSTTRVVVEQIFQECDGNR